MTERQRRADQSLEHARRRLRERYGVSLSLDELRGLSELVREGTTENRPKLHRGYYDGRPVYLLRVGGGAVPLAYDPRMRVIVTVFPWEFLSRLPVAMRQRINEFLSKHPAA